MYDYMFEMTESTYGYSVQLHASGSTPLYWELMSTGDNPLSNYISINSATGVLTFHESAPMGAYYFTVFVGNNAGSATQECYLRVNPQETAPELYPPSFNPEPHNYSFRVTHGSGYGATIRASGNPPAEYSLGTTYNTSTGAPNPIPYGVSIDAYSGYLSIGPDVPIGTYYFNIIATNEAGRVGQECTLVIEYEIPGISGIH